MCGLNVAVISTGVANTASIVAALVRVGCNVSVVADPAALTRFQAIVLPGVGAFESAMTTLHNAGFVEPLRAWIASGRPMLAVCLGLQLLANHSEESPGITGLGEIDATITSLPAGVRVPHMGWNTVAADVSSDLLESGSAYFANSYCLREEPVGWRCAWATHGIRFVAAMGRGALLACQFHPELSGSFGSDLIARWSAKAAQMSQEVPSC